MAAKKTTSVVKKQNTAVAYDYGAMAGSGFEDVSSNELSIPFISLLQGLSPQIMEGTVEGAKIGDMYNTVTSELIDSEVGFVFLPVYREEVWIEWVPRSRGGGYAGMHSPNSEVVQNIIKNNGGARIPPRESDGTRPPFKYGENDVIETYNMYGLTLNDDGSEADSFAVISFSATKIKPYRDWLTAMFKLKGPPPLFANRARFKSIKQKNEIGTFANFTIRPLKENWVKSLVDPVSEENLLIEAQEFLTMIKNGMARADFNQQQAHDDEAPF